MFAQLLSSERLYTKPVEDFPYELQPTGAMDIGNQPDDRDSLYILREYTFATDRLRDQALIARGWIAIRQPQEDEPTVWALFGLALEKDYVNEQLLGDAVGALHGDYDIRTNTWKLEATWD